MLEKGDDGWGVHPSGRPRSLRKLPIIPMMMTRLVGAGIRGVESYSACQALCNKQLNFYHEVYVVCNAGTGGVSTRVVALVR